MITSIQRKQTTFSYKALSYLLAFTFIFTSLIFPQRVQAQTVLNLPLPGAMVTPSSAYIPSLLRGIKVYPDNPFRFDFIVHSGNSEVDGEEFKEESKKLIKYFLASLTTPEDDLWVNLSPYEKDRITANDFGQTEMGRDLLAQDYVLKQLTASLIYPEDGLGKKFWERVYQKAYALYKTTEIPLNTFNKVWIMPDKATVYEHENTVFVAEGHLKVLLEEDYLAMDFHQRSTAGSKVSARGLALNHHLDNQDKDTGQPEDTQAKEINVLSSRIIKEVVLPEIEREVNHGKNFAQLRQIYYSLILALWYKQNLQASLFHQVYADQNKTAGIDVQDKQVKQKIYDQYMQAFKQGVYDYIKEDYDPHTQEMIPRRYFSGGFTLPQAGLPIGRVTAGEIPPGAVSFDDSDTARLSIGFTQIRHRVGNAAQYNRNTSSSPIPNDEEIPESSIQRKIYFQLYLADSLVAEAHDYAIEGNKKKAQELLEEAGEIYMLISAQNRFPRGTLASSIRKRLSELQKPIESQIKSVTPLWTFQETPLDPLPEDWQEQFNNAMTEEDFTDAEDILYTAQAHRESLNHDDRRSLQLYWRFFSRRTFPKDRWQWRVPHLLGEHRLDEARSVLDRVSAIRVDNEDYFYYILLLRQHEKLSTQHKNQILHNWKERIGEAENLGEREKILLEVEPYIGSLDPSDLDVFVSHLSDGEGALFYATRDIASSWQDDLAVALADHRWDHAQAVLNQLAPLLSNLPREERFKILEARQELKKRRLQDLLENPERELEAATDRRDRERVKFILQQLRERTEELGEVAMLRKAEMDARWREFYEEIYGRRAPKTSLQKYDSSAQGQSSVTTDPSPSEEPYEKGPSLSELGNNIFSDLEEGLRHRRPSENEIDVSVLTKSVIRASVHGDFVEAERSLGIWKRLVVKFLNGDETAFKRWSRWKNQVDAWKKEFFLDHWFSEIQKAQESQNNNYLQYILDTMMEYRDELDEQEQKILNFYRRRLEEEERKQSDVGEISSEHAEIQAQLSAVQTRLEQFLTLLVTGVWKEIPNEMLAAIDNQLQSIPEEIFEFDHQILFLGALLNFVQAASTRLGVQARFEQLQAAAVHLAEDFETLPMFEKANTIVEQFQQRNYYEILGVHPSASQEHIKERYQELARQYHPDLDREDPVREEVFRDIGNAYEALKDPEWRSSYDEHGPEYTPPYQRRQIKKQNVIHLGSGQISSPVANPGGIDLSADIDIETKGTGSASTWSLDSQEIAKMKVGLAGFSIHVIELSYLSEKEVLIFFGIAQNEQSPSFSNTAENEHSETAKERLLNLSKNIHRRKIQLSYLLLRKIGTKQKPGSCLVSQLRGFI